MIAKRKVQLALVIAASLAVTWLTGCGSDKVSNDSGSQPQTARSVILLIGDGMGQAQRSAARLYSVGRDGKLAMDTLPVAGTARNWATESVVTDSAAAATALASGVKTFNKAIGVDVNEKPVPTILELAKDAGKSTGLITTVWLSHATPAGFAAHNADRDDYVGIALNIFENNVDVLLGGGEDYMLPKGTAGCFPDDGDRTDGRNLIDEAVANGYKHVCTASDLSGVDASTTDRLLGTFADYQMTRPYAPSLAEMTDKALAVLDKNSSGFFLMVEGGQIDTAAHVNDAVNALGDVVGFDEAVQVALEYQAQHPETLVIVTADHATGGITIEDSAQDGPCPEPDPKDPRECKTLFQEDGPFSEKKGGEFWVDWTTTNHTAEDVPVMAIGPEASALAGNYENTRIFEVMRGALGLGQ
jgi:alkaline phosphatase